MLKGYLAGVMGGVCQLCSVVFVLLWFYCSFNWQPACIAVCLLVGGSYLKYVSRHTVRVED